MSTTELPDIAYPTPRPPNSYPGRANPWTAPDDDLDALPLYAGEELEIGSVEGAAPPDHRLDDRPPPGPPGEPSSSPGWFRWSFGGLLTLTGIAYLWGLAASGWANAYYSAAAQAGASSWKAFLFGSFDASNAITVDKPPASLWVMGLSARLFGVSSWSILVPEALMGVGTVALVVLLVRRWFSPGGALLAGAVLASTPIAALMFRFNNPDALLVLLLTGAAYAVTRALEQEWGSTRWMAIAGALVGFGFLAKMLQAFLVLPAFALVYLVAGPPKLGKRIMQLAVLGASALAAAGWWVALVELWPKGSRPYIGGSQTNSVLELVFGYNGLGRLTGNETGSVGGGAARAATAGGNWGPTGWTRLFNASYGGQASWLLPAALAVTVIGLAATWRRPRTDRTRAALLLWGVTLFVTGVTFSLSKGIIHEYYTVALVPAIGVLVGIGGSLAWQHRTSVLVRLATAGTVAGSALWAWTLLGRTPSWNPWVRDVVAVAGVLAAAAIALGAQRRRLALVAAGLSTVAVLAGPVAYSATTVTTVHTGSLPSAGPRVAGSFGPGGGRGPAGFGGAGVGAGGPGVGAGGATNRALPAGFQPPTGGVATGGTTTAPGTAAGNTGGPAGGMGGLLNAWTPSAALVTVLQADGSSYTWAAAAVGANEAAGYQLASDEPVLAIGGFNGSDPSPTLAEFKALVAARKIHYFIGSGRGGFGAQMGGSNASSEISSWVTSTYTATTIGGTTVYDLSAAA